MGLSTVQRYMKITRDCSRLQDLRGECVLILISFLFSILLGSCYLGWELMLMIMLLPMYIEAACHMAMECRTGLVLGLHEGQGRLVELLLGAAGRIHHKRPQLHTWQARLMHMSFASYLYVCSG